jgi:hypothetical protein
MRLPRMTTRQGMMVVAGSSVVFASFGVNVISSTLIAAFLISFLIVKPVGWREWLILLIAALSAPPWVLLASAYTFAFRAALYLGHWPYYAHPDPKDLPARFHPQSEILEFLIPTIISVIITCKVWRLVIRLAPWPRPVPYALTALLVLWLLPIVLAMLDPLGVFEWIVD